MVHLEYTSKHDNSSQRGDDRVSIGNEKGRSTGFFRAPRMWALSYNTITYAPQTLQWCVRSGLYFWQYSQKGLLKELGTENWDDWKVSFFRLR